MQFKQVKYKHVKMSGTSKSDQNDNSRKGINNEDNHDSLENLKTDASTSASTTVIECFCDVWKDDKKNTR